MKKFNTLIISLIVIVLFSGCSNKETISSVIRREDFSSVVMFTNSKTSIIIDSVVLNNRYELISQTSIKKLSDKESNNLIHKRLVEEEDLHIVFSTSDVSAGLIFLTIEGEAYLLKGDKNRKDSVIYSIILDSEFESFWELVIEHVEEELIIE